MYSIGEFSKLVNISVKTLRYYHEIALFSPSFIDVKTNYRYYSFDKFSEIEKIKLLKSFGLSLDEIRILVVDNMSDLKELLTEQQKKLTLEKLNIEDQLSLINDILKKNTEVISNDYQISHVKFEERDKLIVLSVKDFIDMKDINLLVKRLFEKSYAYDVKLAGNLMVTLTLGTPLSEVEVMMAVVREKNQKASEFTKVIPSGKYAYLFFRGLYSDLHHAYAKLGEHATNELPLFIEEYIEGLLPENMDKPLLVRPDIAKHPNTFITKILMKL